MKLQSDAADQEVAAAWVAEIELALHDFSVQPEGWEEADAQAFMSSCGRIFGVHDVLVPSLLRTFHARAEPARFAIMVKLLRAESFAYLRREIETMPEEMNLDIDDPTAALQALVRDVFAGNPT